VSNYVSWVRTALCSNERPQEVGTWQEIDRIMADGGGGDTGPDPFQAINEFVAPLSGLPKEMNAIRVSVWVFGCEMVQVLSFIFLRCHSATSKTHRHPLSLAQHTGGSTLVPGWPGEPSASSIVRLSGECEGAVFRTAVRRE
jgi:hypothetical protein